MLNKNFLNKLLRRFNVEVHGVNYIKRLKKSAESKDAFSSQSKLVKDPKVIFDVGSNRGIVSKAYHDMFNNVVIHAFEPNVEYHPGFKDQNVNTNYILNSFVLSDSNNTLPFYLNKSGDTNSLYSAIPTYDVLKNVGMMEVQSMTLDEYCIKNNIEHIDILKMDTQGAEYSILKGATNMLSNKKISLIYTEGFLKPQYNKAPLMYEIGSLLAEFDYFLEDIYEPFYDKKFMLQCDAIFLSQ